MIDWYRLLPYYWSQKFPTNLEWDKALNDALDNCEIEVVTSCVVQIGTTRVWVENYPYAFGRPHMPEADVLPTVKTRKRLWAMIAEQLHQEDQNRLKEAMDGIKCT